MAILKGRKVIIIGDRDGIPGPAIEECVKSAGGETVFSSTECFV
jgi:betaine reductase